MSIDQRLSRLAPALTAQERAILILEAWKAGKPEDPAWRRSMPREQSHAFNRYIELMNRANVVLGRMVGVIAMQTDALEQREMWLVSLALWQEHIDEIRAALRLAIREPITESEYAARVAQANDRWVPLEELASFLAAEREDYADDDFYETEDGSVELRDEVWDRAVAEEEERLRALVAAGRLESRGSGKRLKLRAGAIGEFGHEVGAVPEEYLSFRIVPDSEAEEVERERRHLEGLQRVLAWQSFLEPGDRELAEMPEKMREQLKETTAYRLITRWVELRCVEVLVDEISQEFNGIDPLRPYFREKLNSTRQRLEAISEHLKALNMEVVLRDPLPEEVDEMRGWLAEVPGTN